MRFTPRRGVWLRDWAVVGSGCGLGLLPAELRRVGARGGRRRLEWQGSLAVPGALPVGWTGMPVTEHIRKKVSTLPHKPGIYLMRDRFGTVIYVGKARDL